MRLVAFSGIAILWRSVKEQWKPLLERMNDRMMLIESGFESAQDKASAIHCHLRDCLLLIFVYYFCFPTCLKAIHFDTGFKVRATGVEYCSMVFLVWVVQQLECPSSILSAVVQVDVVSHSPAAPAFWILMSLLAFTLLLLSFIGLYTMLSLTLTSRHQGCKADMQNGTWELFADQTPQRQKTQRSYGNSNSNSMQEQAWYYHHHHHHHNYHHSHHQQHNLFISIFNKNDDVDNNNSNSNSSSNNNETKRATATRIDISHMARWISIVIARPSVSQSICTNMGASGASEGRQWLVRDLC